MKSDSLFSMKIYHLNFSTKAILCLVSCVLLIQPIYGIENPPVDPPDENPDCEKCDGQTKSFHHYFTIGRTAYVKTDMLTLARKPATAGSQRGNNPATFDDYLNSSFNHNVTSNLSDLKLTLDREKLDASALSLSSLQVTRGTSSEVIDRDGAIRQVVTADTIVDVLPLTVGYHVKVYDKNAKGAKNASGLYIISSTGVPIMEWIMRTPSSGAFVDTVESVFIDRKNSGGVRVEIKRFVENSSHTVVNKQTYSGALDSSGNAVVGSLLENECVTYSNLGSKPYDYTLVRETSRISTNASGAQYGSLNVVERRLEEYRDFTPGTTGGDASYKRMVREVDGYGSSDPRETRYSFYENPANVLINGRLKSVLKPDGNWEYYQYTDSENAAVFQQVKYSAWRDASFGSSADGSQADLANAKKEVVSVSSTTGYTRVVSYAGVITNQEEFTSIPQPDGSLLNSTTLKSGTGDVLSVRIWKLNSSTAAGHLAGRIAWMENPDGTSETFTYAATAGGGFQLIDRKGAGNRNGVTSGSETITEYNSFGESQAVVVKDIASGLTLKYWMAPSVDILGRPTRIEYNGNTNDYETFQYSCCGLEHKRNRDGSVTTWLRDPLKRIYRQVDYRFAADNSPLITATSYDGLTTTEIRGGILKSQSTELLNRETTSLKLPDQNNDGIAETTMITRSADGRKLTKTYPDGGTEIRETYLDGSLKSLTGTAVSDQNFVYGTHTQNGNGLWSQEIKLTSTGGTGEWEKTYNDSLARVIRRERPSGTGTAVEISTYHGTGGAAGAYTHLASFTDADGKLTTYGYDSDGHVSTTSEQMPGNQSRITVKVHVVVNDSSLGVCEKSTAQINGVLGEVSLRSGDGYSTQLSSMGRATTTVKTVSASSGNATVTTINPDGTKQVRTIVGNLLSQVANFDTYNNLLTSKSYTYNSHRQVASITDARTGTTTVNSYTPAGHERSITDPGGHTTVYGYDVIGRRIFTDAPDTLDGNDNPLSNVTHTSWYLTGLERATWGDQTYPAYFVYDEQGRMSELRTYRNLGYSTEPTAATPDYDMTIWTYNVQGLLANKRYPDNQGPNYTYTASGKVATRIWARGGVTAYSYDKGLLTFTDYSDSTPDIAILYDARGRKSSVVQTNQSKVDYGYNPLTLALNSETVHYDLNHDGNWDFTRVLERSQDSLLRDTGWKLKAGTTVENSIDYGYDHAGRISSFSKGSNTFNYGYLANSNLISTVSGPVHTVTNSWDTARDVLLTKENKAGSIVISKYDYSVNAIGQRIAVAQSGSAFASATGWNWGYDSTGQVIRSEQATSPFNNSNYQYDTTGNRKKSVKGLPLAVTDNYFANSLNQYTTIEFGPSNSSPSYDEDGNMAIGTVSTGSANMEWDGENRLISATVGGETVRYYYDHQFRRIGLVNSNQILYYVYDDRNLLLEYDSTSGKIKDYTWGLDLSGRIRGAGGIGGLLSVTDTNDSLQQTFFPAYDANGNIVEYLSGSGNLNVHFEYDVFGNVLVNTNSESDFSYGFSTKVLDRLTGMYDYGYRFYDPFTGRWVARDPIEEEGGNNLYAFGRNQLTNQVDADGRWIWGFLADRIKKKIKSEIRTSGIADLGGSYIEPHEMLISKEPIGSCCVCEGSDGKPDFEGPIPSCSQKQTLVGIMYNRKYATTQGGYEDEVSAYAIEPGSEREEKDECPPELLK